MKGILSRGDRLLFPVIEKAYKIGYYDEWGEYFSYEKWSKLFQEIDISRYTGPYGLEDFPWDHLDSGVDKNFLWSEYQKYFSGETTIDCRARCTLCRVCIDYKVSNTLKRR